MKRRSITQRLAKRPPRPEGDGMSDLTFPPETVERIQPILDQSAATATPIVGKTFAREDRRDSAETFLKTWNGVRMCTVASAGPNGTPHIAVVHASFGEDGRLTMRMFENSVRQKDFRVNPRVALSKYDEEGSVMMVYGTPREVPNTQRPSRNADGTSTVEVEIDITRIYALSPRPRE